jgi:hypothetical protein
MAFSLNYLQVEGKEIVAVVVRFFPQNTAAPIVNDSTGLSPNGVTRSGVGVFLISFAQNYPEFLGAIATVQLNAFANTTVQTGAFTAGASYAQPAAGYATLAVTTVTGGAAADITANANNSVTVTAFFRKSSVQT